MQIVIDGQTEPMKPEWRDTYSFYYAPWMSDADVTFWRTNGDVKYLVTGAGVGGKI